MGYHTELPNPTPRPPPPLSPLLHPAATLIARPPHQARRRPRPRPRPPPPPPPTPPPRRRPAHGSKPFEAAEIARRAAAANDDGGEGEKRGEEVEEEGVEERVRALRRLVPGGEGMGVETLFEETADYIEALQGQVSAMRALASLLHGLEREETESSTTTTTTTTTTNTMGV
ncbi:transcription factor IBH1-like [Ananas comosus]|uniref:Transcription factor IBH1-like n=1 Tax=Ananas comosus TaxID=4615 RepID=A0A6P5FQ33_ANACO|nr:transcription factor IBH1-like [Ananas comosus]